MRTYDNCATSLRQHVNEHSLKRWCLSAVAAAVGYTCLMGTDTLAMNCATPGMMPLHVEDTFAGTSVNCFLQWDDGTGDALYIGGEFLHTNGATGLSLVRYDGQAYTSVGGGLSAAPGVAIFPGVVHALESFDPDGAGPLASMLIVGGQFDRGGEGVSGVTSPNVIGWDGESWVAMGDGLWEGEPGYNAQVRALAVFDSGSGARLYAAGAFYVRGVSDSRHVARWNGSGWEPVGSGTPSTTGFIFDLHVHNDGTGSKLYAGGLSPTMLAFGGSTTLGRFNGTAWESVGTGPSADIAIQSLCSFDPDGSGPSSALFLAGGRETAMSEPVLYTWNGSNWASHPVPTHEDEPGAVYDGISSMSVHDDGSGARVFLALSQAYVIEPGTPLRAYSVKTWDGALFVNESATEVSYAADGFYLLSNRAVYSSSLGGQARLWLGQAADQNNLQRGQVLVKTGAAWGTAVQEVGTPGTANAAVVWDADGPGGSPGLVYCAGEFAWGSAATFDGVGFAPLPALPGTGTACEVFNDGTGEAFYVAVSLNLNNVLAGTPTTVYKLVGSTWVAVGGEGAFFENNFFNPGTNAARVHDMLVYNDGSGDKLYAAGRFTTVNGVVCNNIARWNGTGWQPVDPANGSNTGLYAVQGQSPLPFYADDQVYRILAHNDGTGTKLYANGRFTKAGGVTAQFIARWDGFAWGAVGLTLPEYFLTTPVLVSHNNGTGARLYAGGFDAESSGSSDNSRIWMWDGASWTNVSAGLFAGDDEDVVLIGSIRDGSAGGTGRRLYAAGYELASSLLARQLYVLDSELGMWSPVEGSFFDGVAHGTAVVEFETALAAGTLMNLGMYHSGVSAPGMSVNASNASRSGMVVWGCLAPSCPADFNGSGSVTVQDIFDFLAAWFAGTTNADFNGSGSVSVQDIFDFLSAWFAGC